MIEITDIKASVLSGTLIQDKFFRNAIFLKDKRDRLISYTGGYTVVFPAEINGEIWALRCWHTPVKDAKKRYDLIGKKIKECQLPYFCSFDFEEKGIIIKGESQPITKMKWIEGKNLKKYICSHYSDNECIKKLAKTFLEMIYDLHNHKIAHGDLQHGNIIVSESGNLFLVDYDSMYVPQMKGNYQDIITGLIDYQHPARKRNKYSSPKLDYFSEIIIYISLLAISLKPELVNSYNIHDSESLLFKSSDFEDLTNSKVYNDLRELKDKNIDLCLEILNDYLQENDINKLDPIDQYLMSIEVECPSTVPQDEPFTVKWTTFGTAKLELSNIGEVPINGQSTFILHHSETLNFTLISKAGFKKRKSFSVSATPRASIIYFKSDKEFTIDTVPVKIEWECINAKRIEILGFGSQQPKGKLIVTPKGEETFTLIVVDDFGVQNRQIIIKRLPLPAIKQILVPTPNIVNNLNINYHAPKFQVSVPAPTFESGLAKIRISKQHSLNNSNFYVPSIGWHLNKKSHNIFKSLFSIFLKNFIQNE